MDPLFKEVIKIEQIMEGLIKINKGDLKNKVDCKNEDNLKNKGTTDKSVFDWYLANTDTDTWLRQYTKTETETYWWGT